MSFRGRVIQRKNVACYLKPESIQEQIQKFRELGRVFRARFYYNICGPTNTIPFLLGKPGLWGQFPYPDLITGALETNCPPESEIWLRIGFPMTFAANTRLVLEPEHGDVHRCVVFVDKSGGVPTLKKVQYFSPWADKGQTIDAYCNETVFTTDDRKLIVATTGGSSLNPVEFPCDRTRIDIPPGDIEIYMVLFCTQMDIISAFTDDQMAYTGPITVDEWANIVFS